MRYIQRQNKDVNKDNEIYTKAKQRCKQRQWDIYKGKNVNKDNEIYTKNKETKTMRYIQRQNKDANKDNEIYKKAKQRCKQRKWDIYKG